MKVSLRKSISARWDNRPDAAALRRIALFSMLLFFAAHAFCFFNLTYSGNAVMVDASRGSIEQLSDGQFLQPLYWRIRGGIAAPLWVGMLSALYLTLSAVSIAWLLGIRSPLGLFALCSVLIANPAVTSVCSASMHTADAVFLALLLGSTGALLSLRTRWGFLPGACLYGAALALEPTALSCGAVLTLLALLCDALKADSIHLPARTAKAVSALMIGFLGHAVGCIVLSGVMDLDLHAALLLPSFADAFLAPLRMQFGPLTAYTRAAFLLRILLLLITAFLLIRRMRGLSRIRAVLVAVMVLLLPLAANLPMLSAQAVGQTAIAYALPDLLPIALLASFAGQSRFPQSDRLTASVFGVLFLSAVVFSNQVYLKKNLEFESTVSVMTRVIDRAEQVEGYQPGLTPTAIVGTLDDSVLSVPRIGFEHLEALDAARGNYAPQSADENLWYLWSVLGYPFNFISSYERDQLQSTDAVLAMPSFPSEGCCAMVGGTLVIKLSEPAL